MTKEQSTLLSFIRAIVRGAQDVPLATDVGGSNDGRQLGEGDGGGGKARGARTLF